MKNQSVQNGLKLGKVCFFFFIIEYVTTTSTGEAGENINYRAPTNPYKVTHKHNNRTEKHTQQCSMETRFEKIDVAPGGDTTERKTTRSVRIGGCKS